MRKTRQVLLLQSAQLYLVISDTFFVYYLSQLTLVHPSFEQLEHHSGWREGRQHEHSCDEAIGQIPGRVESVSVG